MTEFNLAVGAALNLQIINHSKGHRIQARLLGYKSGESLIVEVQGAALPPVDIRVGDELAVRCLIGRHILGFKSTVMRTCISPYSYFHLSFPQNIEQTEVRHDERVVVSLPVQVSTAAGLSMDGEIHDISASGAMLIANQSLGNTGDNVQLMVSLTFAQVTRGLTLSAVIRNVQAVPVTGTEGATTYRIGVQFKDVNEDEKLFLLSFAYEQLSVARGTTSPAAGRSNDKS